MHKLLLVPFLFRFEREFKWIDLLDELSVIELHLPDAGKNISLDNEPAPAFSVSFDFDNPCFSRKPVLGPERVYRDSHIYPLVEGDLPS